MYSFINSKSFDSMVMLEEHAKKFICRVCDKNFAQKQAMKRHLFSVNNLHPFSRMF